MVRKTKNIQRAAVLQAKRRRRRAGLVKADRKVTVTENNHTLQQWCAEEHL